MRDREADWAGQRRPSRWVPSSSEYSGAATRMRKLGTDASPTGYKLVRMSSAQTRGTPRSDGRERRRSAFLLTQVTDPGSGSRPDPSGHRLRRLQALTVRLCSLVSFHAKAERVNAELQEDERTSTPQTFLTPNASYKPLPPMRRASARISVSSGRGFAGAQASPPSRVMIALRLRRHRR